MNLKSKTKGRAILVLSVVSPNCQLTMIKRKSETHVISFMTISCLRPVGITLKKFFSMFNVKNTGFMQIVGNTYVHISTNTRCQINAYTY